MWPGVSVHLFRYNELASAEDFGEFFWGNSGPGGNTSDEGDQNSLKPSNFVEKVMANQPTNHPNPPGPRTPRRNTGLIISALLREANGFS